MRIEPVRDVPAHRAHGAVGFLLDLGDGARDGAVARAVHDYLYAMKDRKVSCTLTVISADLETETVVISRNSNCPTIVVTPE